MNRFFSSKISDNSNNVQTKRNSIGKVTIALCFFISVGFSIAFLYQSIYPLNAVFISFTVIYAIAYFVFSNKNILLGKILLYVAMLVHTFFLSYSLGQYVQIKLFYIPISIVPLLIFSKEEKNAMYAMLVLTAFNIVLINTTIHLFEIPQTYSLETYRIINNAFDITSMLCMVILAFLFLQLTEAGEIELLKANTELSTQKEREQKTNFILKRAKEDQERLNLMKDYLFRIISHDLRSPVNTIHGLTELLVSGNLTKEEERLISETLKRSAESTTHLLDNLLKWSVFQINNSSKPIIDKVNLKELINDIFNQLEVKANQKSILLIDKIPNNLLIDADANMLEIVLRNLISNSIKFSYVGQAILILAEKNETHLSIQVKDSGMGISQEILDKLFTNDKSVCREGTHEEKGTGIGLLLCKNLVESLGGTIKVESVPKYQTIFIVQIPLKINDTNLTHS
ncbi:sensor histidine kinase [Cytophaga aurantiaca]|uniref:sensor histidine kinase n=1 Tax=Cytophaga aurantiaca TaxID=29530 RepID=UPI00037C8FE0|nr:HAMP domain-containing sensor histidine kinase [Cytophaga aurantiaca]